MERKSRKLLSVLLSICMLATTLFIPLNVQAEDPVVEKIATMGSNPIYSIGQKVGVEVTDTDLTVQTSITVNVVSTTDTTGVAITLNQDSGNPSRFTGEILLSADTSAGGANPSIKCVIGDDVSFLYDDTADSATRETEIKVAERVEAPQASLPEGVGPGTFITTDTAVTLLTGTSDAAVYYTVDGSDPSTNSTAYSDSAKPLIQANKHLILKAFAIKDYMADSAISTFEYNKVTSLNGFVKINETTAVTGGCIDIEKDNGNNKFQYQTFTPVNSADGSFSISGLNGDGKYRIRANPNFESEYTFSDWYEFMVTAGSFKTVGGAGLTEVTLTPNTVQVKGTAKSSDGVTDLEGNQFFVKVRPADPNADNNIKFDCGGGKGAFKLSRLPNGSFYIWIEPSDGSSADTPSFAKLVDINGGVASPSSISLQMTAPQLAGTVVRPDGSGGTASVAGGNVDILTVGGKYLQDARVQPDGSFKIGGLFDGNYKIRANPPGVQEYKDYQASDMMDMTVSGGNVTSPSGAVTLQLKDKKLWVEWVENACKGEKEIRVRMNNLDLIGGNCEGLTMTVSGTTYNYKYADNWNNNSATVRFNVPDGLNLNFGGYLVVVYNGADNPVGGSGLKLNVIQYVDTTKPVIPQAEYSAGTSIQLYAQNDDYPWDAEGTGLTAKITLSNPEKTAECSAPAVSGTDRKLTVNIPAIEEASAGWREINIYRDSDQQLLASGKFQVGSARIDGAYTINQGDNRAGIYGDCLAAYSRPDTRAEVWKDGSKLAVNTRNELRDNRLEFEFPIEFNIPGDTYTIKVYDDSNGGHSEISTTGGIGFAVAPLLASAPHSIPMGGDEITIYSSTLDAFKWSGSDGISNFKVNVFGDGFGWDVNSANGGITFDGSGNLVVSPLAGGHSFGSNVSKGRMEVYRGDKRLGYAEFTVGEAVVFGKVLAPGTGSDTVSGGKVNIQNQNKDDNSGRWVSIGTDGRFYISRDDVPRKYMDNPNIDGKYTLTAIPTEGAIYASSRPVTIVISGGALTVVNDIELRLEDVQLKGSVKIPDGTLVNGGNVEVFDNSSERKWVANTNIYANGTFGIGGLASGTYWVKAHPSDGGWFLSSDMLQVTTGKMDIVVSLKAPQVSGKALDADGNNLRGDKYSIRTRSLEYNDWNSEWHSNDGYYVAGNLAPGRYGIRIAPNDDSVFTQSLESEFTVTAGSTATVIADLKLTTPQFSGNVVAPDGITAITSGSVDILTLGSKFLTKVNIHPDGTFKVGGLSPGEYYIGANPGRDNPAYNGYDSSEKVLVTIDSNGICTNPANKTLTLRPRATRLKGVGNLIKGDGFISARIKNAGMITDWGAVRAEITSGTSVLVNISHCYGKDYDGQTDECNVNMDSFDDSSLAYGKYSLKLYYHNVLIPAENSSEFYVISGAYTDPAVVAPNEYNGKSLLLDVGREPKEYPWSTGDQLTIRITSDQNKSIQSTASAIIIASNALSFNLPNLPAENILEGKQNIEVFRNYGSASEQLLAVCGFEVGVTQIKEIKVREGIPDLIIAGKYMNKYMSSPYIEVYQGTAMIARGNKWFNFWGNLSFNLPVSLIPGVDYKVRLYSGINGEMQEATLPNAGVFRVIPRLDCENPVITGQTTGEAIMINESSDPVYQWVAGQDIQAFFTGPDGRYYGDATSSSGLTVNENSIQYTTTKNDFMNFPLGHDVYTMDIFSNTGVPLGYTQFIVDDADVVLVGTVKGSDNNNTSGGAINISKNNDNWGTSAPVGQDGKFYLRMKDFKDRDGQYTLTAFPSSSSPDSQGTMTFSVSGGAIYVSDTKTNNITVQLLKTQVKGQVLGGGTPVNGGRVYFDLNSWEKTHYEADVDLDGNYRLGGLKPGSYSIRARAPDYSAYLVSDSQELTIGAATEGSTTIVRNLDLKMPQITGTALNFDSSPLKGYNFSVRIRNLDQFSDGKAYYESRTSDGQYMAGGLQAGKYAIAIEPKDMPGTRSLEGKFVVDKDGIASPSVIDLKFAGIQLVGTVFYKTAAKSEIFNDGYVDVFSGSWNDLKYLTTVSIDKYGKFSIGGLPGGKYWIRAAISERWKYPYLSQSRTTEITLSDTGMPATVDLYMGDQKPRIKWVNDYDPLDDKIYVRMVNVEPTNNIGGIDFSKMSAEILDSQGNPISPAAITVAGAGNFYKQGETWDDNKNEVNVVIKLGSNERLMPGKYKLKLMYNYGSGVEEVENETPATDGFNGFTAYYKLNIDPFDVKPESTSGRVLKLGLNIDKNQYPWAQGDTLTVRMTKPDKSKIDLPCTIAGDKSVSFTLPAEALTVGIYLIELFKGDSVSGKLIAKNRLTVGYPEITSIYDINEEDNNITLDGSCLITYLDKPSAIEVRDSSNNLVAASSDVNFMWGKLVFSLDGKTLAPGNYKLSMTYSGNPVTSLPNGGKFKVVNLLIANPSYMITGKTSGKVMTFSLKADAMTAPWSLSDSLIIEMKHDDGSGSFTTIPSTVSTSAVAITMPNMLNEGPCSVNVFKVDGAGVKEYIAYSRFDMTAGTQMTGVVKDPSGNPLPYAKVTVCINNDKEEWVADFTADKDGKYAIYGVKPITCIIFAQPPKGVAMLESDRAIITLSDGGPINRDFQLKAARKISGRIKLPGSETVSGNAFKMWLGAWADRGTPDNKDDDRWIGSEVVIPAGANGADYSVLVPVDDTQYRLQLWSGGTGYLDGAIYYSTSGTAIRVKDATLFQVNSGDKTGMDLTLIKGKVISGTVSLPAGVNANGDGVKVKINAGIDNNTKDIYDDVNFGTAIMIDPGNDKFDYKIVVPASSGYQIKYDLETSMKLIGTGFYKSATESAYKYQAASTVDASTANQGNINLVLMNARYITGTVTLPAGAPIPEKGIGMWIGANADQGTKDGADDYCPGANIHFAQGQNSSNYSISVPDSAETYWLQLWGGTQIDCIDGVYYGNSGISYNLEGAARFTVNGNDKPNMNFNLLKGKVISGTVSLPTGVTATEGGIKVKINVEKGSITKVTSDDVSFGTGVTIQPGQSSADYKIVVPAAAGYDVKYDLETSMKLVRTGYYKTESVSAYKYPDASSVDASTVNQENINLILMNARYITGTITLPAEVTVPSNGIGMWIGACADQGTKDGMDDYWSGTEVKFAGGQNSSAYTISVPDTSETYWLQLWGGTQIECIDGVYYGTTGAAFNLKEAARFSVSGGDKTGMDMTLQKGKVIKGTVSLPTGVTATAGGIKVKINVEKGSATKDTNDDVSFGTEIMIDPGNDELGYEIVVPAASGYIVKYDLETSMKLAGTGYYKTGTESAYKYQGATIVDVSTINQDNINLILMNARYITGTVTLPAGMTAPAGGIGMWIGAIADQGTKDGSDDYCVGANINFAQGQNSSTYMISVPDSTETYRLQLWGGTQIDCVDGVYYGSSGISFNPKGATTFSVNGGDKTGMNLALVKGKEISGTFILPEGVVAPAGGMGMSIEAVVDNNTDNYLDDINVGTKVNIAQGTTSAAFKMIVPAAAGFRVQYVADPTYGFMERGYYSETGTTFDYAKAGLLDMSLLPEKKNIQLNAVKARYITGTVTLPTGVVAPAGGAGIWIDVCDEKVLSDPSDDFWTGTEVYFAGNTASAAYKVAVLDNSADVAAGRSDGYVIQVLNGSKVGCVDTMYYSKSGSAFRISDAAKVDIGSGDQDNINIALEKGYKITGKVTLPTGINAPENGMGMSIVALVKSESGNNREDIRIFTKTNIKYDALNGKSSGVYVLYVPDIAAVKETYPDATGFRVMYAGDNPDQFELRGFYRTASETTPDYDKATALDATGTGKTGIDLNVISVITPACTNASVVSTGTAIRLDFSKPLAKVTTAAGFSVKVGTDEYELAGVVQSSGGTSLTLQLKDYYIYKDYSNIQVTYSGASGVKTYDGKPIPSFTNAVTNSSTRVYAISGVANNALFNRSVKLTVTSTNDVVTIRNPDGTNSTTGSAINERIFDNTGIYNVIASATGRKAVTALSFEIDKMPPVVTITNVPDNTENSHDGVKPSISFSGDVSSMRTITLNGQAYDGITAIKDEGHYVLSASTKDKAGNITTASKAFDIAWDMGAPVISVNIANGEILGSNPSLSINLTGGNNAVNYSYTATLKKPDGSITEFTKANIPAIAAEGVYRLDIKAVNPSYADVTSTKVIEFTLDKTNPVAAIGNVTNNKSYNTSVTPVISFTDSVASQQLLTSNAAITLTRDTSPVAFKPGDTLTIDGRYDLRVSTTDGKGHTSNTEAVTFDIDRTKPVITLSGALDGYTYKDENITITATSLDGNLSVMCNDEPLDLIGGKHTFTGTSGASVVYKLVFTSTDAAQNVSEQHLSFTIDKLPVNILISGISEGQTINYSPDISYAVYEGETAIQGATATIDGSNFAGGTYGTEGNHILAVKYEKGGNIYTKTIHFTVDKTKPVISNIKVYKNGSEINGELYAKAGDTIKITAVINDNNAINESSFNIGTAAVKVPMKVSSGSLYEGEFKVEGGNFSNQGIMVNTRDIAGNTAAGNGPSINIFNTKPSVSLATTPSGPDGNNGIFRSPSMSLTMNAAATDTIYYYFNGVSTTVKGTKTLTPTQGINTLIYYAINLAGIKSDEKAFVFEYDSEKPENVNVNPALKVLDNKSLISIAGTVPGEVGKVGSRVLLKKVPEDAAKQAEVVAQAVITSSGAFLLDNVRLTEGDNKFELVARDAAGNESAAATTATRKLDSTAPIVKVEKAEGDEITYNVEVLDQAVSPSAISAKFNGADIAAAKIADNGAITGGQKYTITVPGQIEGSNTLNVLAVDMAGNTGSGSFTSTFIPPDVAQNDLPLSDNASMDIPANAFSSTSSSIQMLVKTVDVQGIEEYKPLGAPISFEFKEEDGTPIEPEDYLVIRNFIGTGLTGVVLMHIKNDNSIDSISAEQTTSGAISEAFIKDDMKSFEEGYAYYLSDTGYLIFKTKSFSAYQVVQDNTPPVITVTTMDFDINKADAVGEKKVISGVLDDATAYVTEVTVDGNPFSLSGTTGAAFNIPLTLPDGTHEVVLKASDAVGNVSSVTRTYNVDATSPVLSATAAVAQTNSNTVDININVSENSEIKMNGSSRGFFNGSNVIPYTLSEGANTIFVTATDAFGNTTTATTIVIEKDSTKPEITITGVSEGDIYGGAVNIAADADDEHLSQKTVTMDGISYTPGSYSTVGRHTLAVSASDTFGNTVSQSVIFTIDTSVPSITATGAANGGIYNSNKTLVINASNADEGKFKVTKSVDGQPAQNVTVTGFSTSVDLTANADTEHTYVIQATATKVVGGQVRNASTTYSVTIDRKKPVITSTTAAKSTTATVNITGTIDETADIYLDDVLINSEYPAGAFTFTNISLVAGDNVFTVKAVDKAGNQSTKSITVAMDSTAPSITITGVSEGNVYGGAVNIGINVTDTHLDSAQTIIKMDGASFTPGSYNTNGRHTLVVSAADTFGNMSSRTVNFTIDLTRPDIVITGASDGGFYNADKTLVITANNAEELTATKSTDGQPAQNITVTGLSTSVELTADTDTMHRYVINAYASKVVAGESRNSNSTYTVTIDKKKPVITSTTAAETTSASISITGTVDETVDLYLNGELKNQGLPAGNFTFTGLTLNLGDNTFAVKAVDKAGNESPKDIKVVRKATVTPPPVTPGGDNVGPGGGGGPVGPVVAPAPVVTSGSAILTPLERNNNGELNPVTEPNPGTAIDSAENTAIGTTGGAVSTSGGAFGLTIPAGAVAGNNNTFRLVVFEVDPKSPLALEDQVKAGTIKLVSDVVDFGTTADVLLKPVTATFHYDRQAVTNAQNLRVFYWNARTNAWVPVAAANTRVNPGSGLIEADLLHFTRYAVMEVKSKLKFADVQTQWYATYVDRISVMGVTTGIVTKGTRVFKPDTAISRVEFVAMLARTLKLSAPSQSLSAFKDASAIPAWAVGYIKAAVAKGIINPYKDGTFKPTQNITREEMAVMLIKAMGLKPSGDASSFKDQKDISATARAYVAKAAEKNILSGKGDGMFHPADPLTRAEAAKVIIEMIEVLGTL